MRGATEEQNDVTTLLEHEKLIKEICQKYKTFLDAMAAFGGEEVVEI